MSIPILTDLPIGSIVSFEVTAPVVLATSYQDCKVCGYCDVEGARLAGDSPYETATAVQPTLPEGAPTDPRDYMFVTLELPNGKRTNLGLPWIRKETIVVKTNTQHLIRTLNTGPNDTARIMELFARAGIKLESIALIGNT